MIGLQVIAKRHYSTQIDLSHLDYIKNLGYQIENTVLSELHMNDTEIAFVSMAKYKGYFINTISISELDYQLKRFGLRIQPL